MNQIVLGASGPFLVVVLVYLVRRGRVGPVFLACSPLLLILGSIWAVVPDLPRLIGRKDLYDRLAQDPRTDIFLYHYTIDRMETDSAWWVVAFVAMVGTLTYMAWRQLSRAEGRPR